VLASEFYVQPLSTMKITTLQALIAVVLLTVLSPVAIAAPVKFSESQTDKLKCKTVDGIPNCEIETTGKYQAQFRLPNLTLENKDPQYISFSSVFSLAVGDFQFADSISNALGFSGRSAVWKEFHEECNAQGKCKQNADTKIIGKIGGSNVSLNISGTSKSTGGLPYGNHIFAKLCEGNGDGYSFRELVSVSIDGIFFNSIASGTCSFKLTTKSKNGQNFDLTTIDIKGSIEDLQ
jgi:hypothetical protein